MGSGTGGVPCAPPTGPLLHVGPQRSRLLKRKCGTTPPRAPGQEPRTHHCTTGVGNPCTVKQSFTDILSQTVWDLRRTRISGARRIRSKYE